MVSGEITAALPMNSGRERVERRPAAVLMADIAVSSRLTGAGEEGTLVALEHRGRIVKTTGDGLPFKLPSAVDARVKKTPEA
jgi:class 3 adenylate cyclase